MKTKALFAAIILAATPLSGLAGQEVWPEDCDTCSQPVNIGLAIGEVVLINGFVNGFNRLTRGEEGEFAYVSPASWLRNLNRGWEFDDNDFKTNQIAHPYHGSTYFNAARSNGIEFWGSTLFAFGGSLMWEYFGETHRPAPNDLVSTAVGGIALGEMLYRTSSLVLDNTATGGGRIWREVGATLLNPIRGFNRLIHGDWTRVGANPPDRRPTRILSVWDVGVRPTGEDSLGNDLSALFAEFDFWYGSPFQGDYKKPYETFELRLQFNGSDKAVVGRVQQSGLLSGTPLWDEDAPPDGSRHMVVVSQHFDYVNNDAIELGSSAIGVGLLSRFPLGKQWNLSTRVIPKAVIMGGMYNPLTSIGKRDYDFGSGLGLEAFLMLWWKNRQVFEASYWGEWQYTIAGTQGTNIVHVLNARARVPILSFLGLGGEVIYVKRIGDYSGLPRLEGDATQVRLFVAIFTDS